MFTVVFQGYISHFFLIYRVDFSVARRKKNLLGLLKKGKVKVAVE